MTSLSSLVAFEMVVPVSAGFRLPARMTVLPLVDGSLALISPIAIDDALARSLAALGEVRFLIAPSVMHHLYLDAAARRYPRATVLAPPGLAHKRPSLRIDHTLDGELPRALADSVDVVRLAGVPAIDEFVFFHRAARTLVVTDLVFNVSHTEGWLTPFVLRVVGCYRRFANSRSWRLLVRDKAAAGHSLERVLALPFETLVMAHGDIVHSDATHDPRAMLADAVRWLLPVRRALPAERATRSAPVAGGHAES